MHLIDNNASLERWKEYYDWILKKFPQEIDNIISPLAEELRLASPKARSTIRVQRINRSRLR